MQRVIKRTKRKYSRRNRVPLVEQIVRELEIEESRGRLIKRFLIKGDGFDSKTDNVQRTETKTIEANGKEYGIILITKENRAIVARDILREMGQEAFFGYGFDRNERFEPLILTKRPGGWKIGFSEETVEHIEIISDRGIEALCKMESGVKLFFDAQEKIRSKRKTGAESRFAGHLVFEGSNLWPCDRWSKIRSRYEALLEEKFFDKEKIIREVIAKNVPRDIAKKVRIKIKSDDVSIRIPECTFKEEIECKIAQEFRVLRQFGMHLHSKEECAKIN
jgi:hypothetical protein